MNKIAILLVSFLLAFGLFFGCNTGTSTENGSISLSIENGIETRLLQPGLDLTPVSYRIIGSGPVNASFDLTTTQTQPKIDFLRFGSWTITIEASNASGEMFASGLATTNVDVGQTTNLNITIRLLNGNGTLTLQVDWPENEIQNPSISGLLKPASGSDINLSFTSGTAPVSKQRRLVNTGRTIAKGYYTLIVQIKDLGASGTENHLAMGVVEVARILNNQITSGIYDLHGVAGMGGLAVNISQDFDEMINVAITNVSSLPSTMAYNSGVTFTALAGVPSTDEDAGNITYGWYLNGQSVGVGDNYIVDMDSCPLAATVNGKYVPGHYAIDVTAFNADGSRGGSTRYEFDVTGNPAEIATATATVTVTATPAPTATATATATTTATVTATATATPAPATMNFILTDSLGSLTPNSQTWSTYYYNINGYHNSTIAIPGSQTKYYSIGTSDGRNLNFTSIQLLDAGNWVTNNIYFYAYKDGSLTGSEARGGDIPWSGSSNAITHNFVNSAFQDADMIYIQAVQPDETTPTPISIDNLTYSTGIITFESGVTGSGTAVLRVTL